MKRITKLVFINVLIIVGLFIIIDFSAGLFLDALKYYKMNHAKPTEDPRVNLPNYKRLCRKSQYG